MINFAAGGPTDVEGRLLAKYLSKHIEGEPTIIVQNRDGAGGLVGTTYLGELAPRDGTMMGYLTGAAWRYAMEPEQHRVDLRTYEFIGYSAGNSVYYVRSGVPPGVKKPADIVNAQGLIVGGLAPDTSKDMLLRMTLDMLGVPFKYITSYRSSANARLAVQNGEIHLHSESTPSYFALIEPSLVKTGVVVPLWYDPNYDGENFIHPKAMQGSSISSFPDFYQTLKGTMPSGPLWDAYRTNLAVAQELQRLVVLPPGTPRAAIAALRVALRKVSDDEEFVRESVKVMQFAPQYTTGDDVNARVRRMMLGVNSEIRNFIRNYLKNRK